MDRIQAQAVLDGPSVAAAASKYAQLVVQKKIREGKIKVSKA